MQIVHHLYIHPCCITLCSPILLGNAAMFGYIAQPNHLSVGDMCRHLVFCFKIFKQMLVNVFDKFSSLIEYNNLCAAIPTGEETNKVQFRSENQTILQVLSRPR